MITILRVDENGRCDAEFSDSAALTELLAAAPNFGHCLQFIDPYGDTTFNQLQIPILAQELRDAVESVPALRDRIESLAIFVESTVASVHTYIKFVGD